MKKHKVYLQDLLNEYPESENYQKFYTYVMELIMERRACSDENAKSNGRNRRFRSASGNMKTKRIIRISMRN